MNQVNFLGKEREVLRRRKLLFISFTHTTGPNLKISENLSPECTNYDWIEVIRTT